VARLAILGASGHGKVVGDAAEAMGDWIDIVYYDDAWPELGKCLAWNVLGDTKKLVENLERYSDVVVAIGDNHRRLEMLVILANKGVRLPAIIHPDATVSRYSDVQSGSVVFAGAIINPGARIGMGCIINTGATIDHDCKLSNGVHVSPGANLSGGIAVGEASWIGVGATVCQLVSIGRDVVVGAGAAVISNVQDSVTVVGVPAHVLE